MQKKSRLEAPNRTGSFSIPVSPQVFIRGYPSNKTRGVQSQPAKMNKMAQDG
uniref:Uncharacterized protein n=1 Tax=Octopus bimaculoides TaxID=37653 RepID=A0A0L8GRL8_OCTBM